MPARLPSVRVGPARFHKPWHGGGNGNRCLCHPSWKQPLVVPAKKCISSVETVAALQKCRVKQAGVVLLGCGGGTSLGSQPCSSRQENARNAGEVEEKEEGCCQLHGRGLSLGDLLTCGTGLLNSVKMMEVATRQSSGGFGL